MKIAIIYHSESGNTEKMAQLVKQGCEQTPNTQARCMSIDQVDADWLNDSQAIILGSPTYEGSCSWQMKKFIDTGLKGQGEKLAGVFASQNWPGGGGASFAEMTMIAGLLVIGMIIYSGGISQGPPYLHFGAVSTKAPTDELHQQRCIKLGQNIAQKAAELFTN